MKIIMLGHSGVGKTTFMASMYAVLQTPVEGFSVVAEKKRLHTRLMTMAANIADGNYPSATTTLSSYPLTLLLEDEAVLDFEWIDYRGNALNESSSSREVEELQNEMDDADGIIVFFDGVELTRGGRSARTAVGRLMVFLQNAINMDEGMLPVALVVTKADLLDDGDVAFEQLRPLATAIAESKTVFGALIFTACAKDVLANVSEPTLFVLYRGIMGKQLRMRAAFEAMAQEAEVYASRAGFFDWIDSKLSGVPTWGEMANSKIDEVNRMIRQHNELVDPANELSEVLKDVFMF